MNDWKTKFGENEDLQDQVNHFPYIVTKLPKVAYNNELK